MRRSARIRLGAVEGTPSSTDPSWPCRSRFSAAFSLAQFSSTCAVPDTFLPKEVPVLATLIYKDANGKERRARSELKERC